MNPFKLYAKYQQAQLDWIRNHFWLWIALNAITIGVFIGYIEWTSFRHRRKREEECKNRIIRHTT